ncbi:Bug family tripartite tricarboxylate transporter substrate binding protein [Variovorax terrae]|uniref:Tripartite tricarboxylate transporter substrate binding protein n=1 Tax=Variovorax terrae TaxID=2923278 RepID=A0A9X1VX07_9BURK|nr:tripartite tricarboxylate transporter substrate binding protein [Variovorax terrae]MCJ0764788.1 tripartite tricarboxylate transporter substrate binding protein [Variovorax terrae]
MKRRHALQLLGTLPLAAALPAARAQAFPDKPVRIVVPFAAGNTLDTALRLVAEAFKQNTGQPMLIDNKPGGSGIIAAQTVLSAPPDGYTLLLANTSMFTINPHTFAKLPYDPEKSFRPVTNFLGSAMVMAVNASVPANNLKEFIAWAKARPGKVSFASFTAGNSSHFSGVILNQRAGIDMVHVPFNGTPPAVQNLVGGQVDAAFLPLLAVKPHMDSGKVKVIAVTSPQRSPLMPGVGTFREQGFPDLEIYIWAAIVAPAATPEAVVGKLNAELVRILKSAEIKDKWRTMDFETLPSTPEEFTRFAQADSRRWAEAVKISGFKASE